MSPEDAEVFDWDDPDDEVGNAAHLAESRFDRPSISMADAESVFWNGCTFVPNKKNRSGDWKMIGITDSGRVLALVISYDPVFRRIRVITGWDATAGERSRYLL